MCACDHCWMWLHCAGVLHVCMWSLLNVITLCWCVTVHVCMWSLLNDCIVLACYRRSLRERKTRLRRHRQEPSHQWKGEIDWHWPKQFKMEYLVFPSFFCSLLFCLPFSYSFSHWIFSNSTLFFFTLDWQLQVGLHLFQLVWRLQKWSNWERRK